MFQKLYGFATILMRKPHLYRDVVHEVLILPDKIESTEIKKLSEAECEILLSFVENLDVLCRDYSRIYRYVARYFDHRSTMPEIPLWIRLSVRRQEREEAEKEAEEIMKAKNNLISLTKKNKSSGSEFTGSPQLRPV